MPDADAFARWCSERRAHIEAVLEHTLPPAHEAPGRLHEAMRYATLGGGKRMRPLLAYAAGDVVAAAAAWVDRAAAAVELIHAYSLVHDDLPAMDNDTLRRGRPTCHVAFGEATALLAGDALQALAFGALSDGPGEGCAARACAILAHAAGSRGMAGGQAIDLGDGGPIGSLEALAHMHGLKTGALIGAAVRLAALGGRTLAPSEAAGLDDYARAAGLAFQVIDDVLDVEGDSRALGKTAGKDAAQGKATFVSMLGVDGAKAEAARLRDAAHAALAPFGAAGMHLGLLADSIVVRRA